MNENKRIIFILVVIVGLFVAAYFLSMRNVCLLNHAQPETFENSSDDTINVPKKNNLIVGGELTNGKDVKGAKHNFNNTVVPMKNPTPSNYVINIPGGLDKKYMIPVQVEKGQTYEISFWINGSNVTSGDNKLNGVIDFATRKGKQTSCVNFRHNTTPQKKTVDGNKWEYKKVLLNAPHDNLEIYLGYHNKEERNITGLNMNKVINNMPGFKVTSGLISSYTFNQNSLFGNEIKNNVGSLHLKSNSSIKFADKEKGVNTLGKTFSAFIEPEKFKKTGSTSIDSFTFVIFCDTLSIDEPATILHVDGNQQDSLVITLNKGEVDSEEDGESKMGYYSMKVGDDTDRYDSKPLFLTGPNIYYFTCSGTHIQCYLNESDIPFWSFETKSKLYFNNNLTINKGGQWNANIKALLVYNRVLSSYDRSNIGYHLKYTQPEENKSKIDEYTFNSCLPLGQSTLYNQPELDTSGGGPNNNGVSEIDIDLVGLTGNYNGTKKFNNDMNKTLSIPTKDNYNPINDLEITVDLEGGGGGGSKPSPVGPGGNPPTNHNNCLEACINNCSSNTAKNDLYDSLNCIKNCKTDIPICKTYCADNKNKPFICTDINLDNVKVVNSCPNVYKQNDNYHVHVPKTSFYGHMYGNKNLTKNYGSSKENAIKVYQQNYPKCELPDSLKDKTNVDPNKCPYIIDERNPCSSSNCKNVDWGDNNYSSSKLLAECKNDIINYCKNNHLLDPNCASWKPENKHHPGSQKHRRQFEDQCDDDCLPGNHPIESHPDYDDYIKKDNIPCWNCNLK